MLGTIAREPGDPQQEGQRLQNQIYTPFSMQFPRFVFTDDKRLPIVFVRF